jgi:hypothetical protein
MTAREPVGGSCLSGEHLRDLDEEHPGWRREFRMLQQSELVEVEVAKIVGSVGHGRDFRPDWVPFVEEDRDKRVFESFKLHGFDAEESARSPISLVECCGEYFVEGDGHRRVSAAHRLKLRTIEAEVFRLERRVSGGIVGACSENSRRKSWRKPSPTAKKAAAFVGNTRTRPHSNRSPNRTRRPQRELLQ